MASTYFYVTILVIFFTLVKIFIKKIYQYWELKGVPNLKPTFPFGTMNNPLKRQRSISELVHGQYNESKEKGYKYVGLYLFTIPQLMIMDPEIIKCVLTKDFGHFMERGIYSNKDDPLSEHIFAIDSSRWKVLRPKLTPTFTSGKMKTMFHIVLNCGHQLKDSMEKICSKGPFNVKEFLECYTMDVIGSCAFGIECNSFTDPSSDFCKYSKRLFLPTQRENIIALIANMFPKLGNLFRLKAIPTDVTNFFINITKQSMKYRREHKIVRNDFFQILMDLVHDDDKDKTQNSISFNEMTAQAFVFFLAGFETSSTTMTFCLLELSLNLEVQNKLREEINFVLNKHNGEITYECLKDLKYMDAVLDETLRKYSPLPLLNRSCIKEYQIPNTNIIIEKGTRVIIPLVGLHNDPEYFSEPEKFDPNRFSPNNKDLLTPFTYMPFGEGPRACIGIRFGVMQTKLGLLMLLKNYKFSMSEKTAFPLKFKPLSFILSVEGDVWLHATKI